MSRVSEPTFATARLRVWEILGNPDPGCGHDARRMYLACVTDIDWPGVAVSASVWIEGGNYLDWIQVSDVLRGHGYGRELVDGLQRHLGAQLSIDATTDSAQAAWGDGQ